MSGALSNDDEDSDDDDYEVGYGNPPKKHRWQKGTSGNPSGKRKPSKDFGEVFRRVAYKKTKITENGRSRMTLMIDAAMRAPMVNALKKNKKNMRYVLELVEEFGLETFTLPGHKPDAIYRDWEGYPAVSETKVPRSVVVLFEEFERKDPQLAQLFLKGLAAQEAKQEKQDGKVRQRRVRRSGD